MYLGSFSPISCVCLWFEIWARERTFLRSSQNTQNTLFRISISSSSRAGKVFQFISNTLYCNLAVYFSTRKQNQSVLLIFFFIQPHTCYSLRSLNVHHMVHFYIHNLRYIYFLCQLGLLFDLLLILSFFSSILSVMWLISYYRKW